MNDKITTIQKLKNRIEKFHQEWNLVTLNIKNEV